MKNTEHTSKYNHPDTLVMVSLYPRQGELYSAGTSGLASYAKNIASRMKRRVIILADIQTKPEVYEEENVLVVRCFSRNSPLMWTQIANELGRFTHTKKLLVQYDFAVYGGILTSSLLLPFIVTARALGYTVSVVSHHVVLDVHKLKGHLGIGDGFGGKITERIYSALFHTFYHALSLTTNNIIVLEDILKKNLERRILPNNVTSIVHGVDTQLEKISKSEARKILGIPQDEYVVLSFGYVNWFKGTDIFAKVFQPVTKLLGKRVHFIIAGGISPTMKTKGYYGTYFADVEKTVAESDAITITGYVPQKLIGAYFSAADLVVFPYRHIMTASGVLSLAFSYKKPFIVSRNLSDMFESPDYQRAFEAAGLSKDDIVFNLHDDSLIFQTERVLKNGIKKKLTNVASAMRMERSYEQIVTHYENVLFSQERVKSPALRVGYT